jgi:hypothetical protein
MKLNENEMLFFSEYKELCKKHELCVRSDQEGLIDIFSLGSDEEIEYDEGVWGGIEYNKPCQQYENTGHPCFNFPSLEGVLKRTAIPEQKQFVNWGDLPKMEFNEDKK